MSCCPQKIGKIWLTVSSNLSPVFFSASLEQDKANTWQHKMGILQQMKIHVAVLKQPSEESWLFIHDKLVTAVTPEYWRASYFAATEGNQNDSEGHYGHYYNRIGRDADIKAREREINGLH